MRKLNALVIDGDSSSRHVVQKLLEQAGFTVEATSLGQEGLTLARKSRFNLVCCGDRQADITGSEFCSKVRAIPQVMISFLSLSWLRKIILVH